MGAVFSSIQPEAEYTLTPSKSIFAITMGAVLGKPPTLIKMRESGTLRAYRVSGVPGWSALLSISLSAFINLILVSTIILISAPEIFGDAAPSNLLIFCLILILFTFANIHHAGDPDRISFPWISSVSSDQQKISDRQTCYSLDCRNSMPRLSCKMRYPVITATNNMPQPVTPINR